jgi:hypothetical protein
MGEVMENNPPDDRDLWDEHQQDLQEDRRIQNMIDDHQERQSKLRRAKEQAVEFTITEDAILDVGRPVDSVKVLEIFGDDDFNVVGWEPGDDDKV